MDAPAPNPRRASYDKGSGLLFVTRDHNSVHGSLADIEAMAKQMLREVTQCRLKLHGEANPSPWAPLPEF